MAVLHVAGLGQTVLRKDAKNVDPQDVKLPEFQQFLDDLIESMIFHQGVGLAAPQVFRSQRVVAVGVPEEMDEDGLGIAPTVFINPQLEFLSNDMVEDWEGCLSLQELRGMVPRHQRVRLQATDRDGKTIDLELNGFCARVLQHELDHLDGKVFLDRMRDFRSLGFTKEFASAQEE